MRDTAETRAVTLVDIPLVKRLSESGIVLDSEMCFTQDATGSQSAGLFTLLLPIRGVHTMVTRAESGQVVGQFRLSADEDFARVAYVAPDLEEGEDDTAWLHLLDTMAMEAGKHGAHILTAEVDENAPLFKTMRIAHYAVYARQEIWCRAPEDRAHHPLRHPIELTEATQDDLTGIHVLYGNIIPRLVQTVTELPGVGEGLVYRKHDRVEGYIGVVEGRSGVYLMPHLHPDVFSEAADIIQAAVNQIERCAKVPVYVRVRRYQDWLDDALEALGFTICSRQAVMVKHIAAGVRAAAYTPLEHQFQVVPHTIKPPTSGATELEACMSERMQ
jgi:hypothetical protein